MVPSSIKNNLAGLRTRERLLTFIWGAACWLSITLALLFLCGFVDWLIDRQRDTPGAVRLGLFFLQAVVASVAALVFVLWPQIRRLPDTLLALWVEAKIPQFQHRLISAVQLNQPNARLDGMSKELVGVVTREAEKLTDRVGGFAKVADHTRLKWSGGVLVPVVLLFALPFAIWPEVCFALLARQALLPTDVPHSVRLENVSAEVWPVGDKIKIFYRVTGEYRDSMVGVLHVQPEGQPGDVYDLTFYGEDERGAIFSADVYPSSTNIIYSARLADGRTKHPSEMRLVARPVIMENQAWVRLPAYCGLKPARPDMSQDQRRYEIEQGKGDLVGIRGSAIKVQFEVASLKHQAWLTLIEIDDLNPRDVDDDRPPPEKERADKIKMDVHASSKLKMLEGVLKRVDTIVAETTFDLTPGLVAYRLFVKDENGFENSLPPRRALALMDEGAPTVRLLRDSFNVSPGMPGFDVEGLPVVIGYPIRIPYECAHKYGLGKAQVMYRILKKSESGEGPVQEEDWIRGPLPEIFEDAKTGPFDTKTGAFAKTEFDEQVEFHAVPSLNADFLLGRTEGGGRYFLKTDGLLDRKTGKAAQLKSGDLIEYCIEVFAANHHNLRGPNLETPSARSESRVTEVKTRAEFDAWLFKVGREDEKVRDLEKKQKGVFVEPK